MAKTNRRLINFLNCMLIVILLLPACAMAQTFPDDHPALRAYPSQQEWLQRIDTAKRGEPREFSAVRTDFDLAIRSSVLLEDERPLLAEERQNHVSHKSLLRRCPVSTRESLEDVFEDFAGMQGGAELIEWYRGHLDELTVEDSGLLRVVLADIIINGWDDWSLWSGDTKLDALRRECREPHRYFAWELIAQLRASEFNGLSLRWLVVPYEGFEVNPEKVFFLLKRSGDVSVVDYLLHAATLDIADHKRSQLVATASAIQPLGNQTRVFRDTWASYLTVPDSTVRAESVLKVGEMVRRLRIYSKGQDNSEDLQARLQRIADEDPDKEARDRAKYALDSIRNAHWREDG